MSAPRVRYDESPMFVLNFPTCSACDVDLDHDGDGWECPKCRTQWGSTANDGDLGSLWADYSGEEFDEEQPAISHGEGWKAAWIEHPYEKWLTESGYDVGCCHKCYKKPFEHVGGAA